MQFSTSIRLFDSTVFISLCAKYSLHNEKGTIQYIISPKSLHELLKRALMICSLMGEIMKNPIP